MLHASRVLGARVGAPLARRAARPLSDAAGGLQLSFSSPHTVFYFEQGVDSVTLPGVSGEYGVTSGHSPLAEQLKPGVVSIIHAARPRRLSPRGGGFRTRAAAAGRPHPRERFAPPRARAKRAPSQAGDEPEKYFVSGGFAFTDDVKTEVSALEAIKLEDLDADKIKAEYSKVASAEDDESKLVAETTKAMAAAIGVTL